MLSVAQQQQQLRNTLQHDDQGIGSAGAAPLPFTASEQQRTRMIPPLESSQRALLGRTLQVFHRSCFKIVTAPLKLLAAMRRAVFRATVAWIAAFLTALLMDPGVNHAASVAIQQGMNLWLTQPHVKDHLSKFQSRLSSQTEPSLAKAAGGDFFQLVFNFLAGMVHPPESFESSGSSSSSSSKSPHDNVINGAASSPVNETTTTVGSRTKR